MSVADRARVTVVTAGHLSTCPRMLKAADALVEDGYEVRVIATRHEPWATETDADVGSRRSWKAEVIDYRRAASGATYWWTGARYRSARALAGACGPARIPLAVVSRAFSRVHTELVRAIAADPGDLIYGGTTGALAAIAEAAGRSGTPYAVDLEDFHSGETSGPGAPLVDALAARIERAVLAGAAFVTTSSEAIASAYAERDGVRSTVIENTFALPPRAPDVSRIDPERLRVYWFSQTIGPGRGLEDAILALGRAGVAAHLALRGRPQPGYLDALTVLAAAHAPRVDVVHLPPAPPDAMVDCARGYDVGLALEQMTPLNRQLCLTNKAFTYILAGMAVAITDTPGQHALGADLGRAAALVPAGDVAALAAAFARWAGDPAELDCAKRTAWTAATRRWHWEHPLERGKLLALVREALAGESCC
jgi:glycosyltransferase involved in cell wall biosynthesis